MRVLIACEESQTVCKAFRELGHEAFSCDIIPCSGGHPEWHIQNDVLNILDKNFWNQNKGWDLMIAHPPCTYLSKAGNSWYNLPGRAQKRNEAFEFFFKLWNCKIPKIAIENPVGYINRHFKPSQIIQPYYFGDKEQKTTCLWLFNLPKLTFDEKMKLEKPKPKYICKSGMKVYWADAFGSNVKDRAKIKSKTFPGIAKAMATQWGAV
jgi:site-specific DNA-cytosine methylase